MKPIFYITPEQCISYFGGLSVKDNKASVKTCILPRYIRKSQFIIKTCAMLEKFLIKYKLNTLQNFIHSPFLLMKKKKDLQKSPTLCKTLMWWDQHYMFSCFMSGTGL